MSGERERERERERESQVVGECSASERLGRVARPRVWLKPWPSRVCRVHTSVALVELVELALLEEDHRVEVLALDVPELLLEGRHLGVRRRRHVQGRRVVAVVARPSALGVANVEQPLVALDVLLLELGVLLALLVLQRDDVVQRRAAAASRWRARLCVCNTRRTIRDTRQLPHATQCSCSIAHAPVMYSSYAAVAWMARPGYGTEHALDRDLDDREQHRRRHRRHHRHLSCRRRPLQLPSSRQSRRLHRHLHRRHHLEE